MTRFCEILTTPPTDLGTDIPGHSAVLVGQQLGQLAVFDEQLSHLRSTNILQGDITGQRLLLNSVFPLLWLNLVMEVQQLPIVLPVSVAHWPKPELGTL